MQSEVRRIVVKPAIYTYIVELSAATRVHPGISLGLSPRASLSIAAMARAMAYLKGRGYVVPEDVYTIFDSVARHRLILSSEAKMNHQKVSDVIEAIKKRVAKPVPERMKGSH